MATFTVSAVAVIAGCSSGTKTASGTPTPGASAPATASGAPSGSPSSSRRSPNVITKEELATVMASTLYDAVQKLRPQMLRSSGATSFGVTASTPSVYVDDQRLGDLSRLKELTPNGVQSVRYFGASEAQSRFGLDNMGGVIQVVMRH